MYAMIKMRLNSIRDKLLDADSTEYPIGFNMFTYHLRLIGICLSNTKMSKFSPSFWLPFIFYVSCYFVEKYIYINCVRDSGLPPLNDTVKANKNFRHGVNRPTYAFSLMSFFVLCFVYETLVWIIFYRRSSAFAKITSSLTELSTNLIITSREKNLFLKRGIVFHCWIIISLVLIMLLYINLHDQIYTNNCPMLWQTVHVTMLNIVILFHEVVAATAVEGLFLFYILYFEMCLDSFNNSLKICLRELTDSCSNDTGSILYSIKRIMEKRLFFIHLNNKFNQTGEQLSTALTLSLIFNLTGAILSVFIIDNSNIQLSITVISWILLPVLFNLTMHLTRISILCFSADNANLKSKETFQILSSFQYDIEKAVRNEMIFMESITSTLNICDHKSFYINRIYSEILIFMNLKGTITFRFSASGFCEISKSLLPALLGALVTYSVILLQNG